MAANRLRISLNLELETDQTVAEAQAHYARTAEWIRSSTGAAWVLDVTVLIDRNGHANWTAEDFDRRFPLPGQTEGQ
jgi:hypothetical protein